MPHLAFLREQRWASLLVLSIGTLMIVLDNTVVNVALASIQHDLGFDNAGLAWVVNAYMIGFAGLLLLAGRLGDLLGTKRVFLAGIVVFTLGSLLCGASINATMLVASRFLQGLGGALASAVSLAVIFTVFTREDERAKALNVFSFTASAGGSVGLLVGGVLTQLLNWHWIFLVNIPIGIVTYVYGARLLPKHDGVGWREGADTIGAALITSSLMIGVYTVVQLPFGGATIWTAMWGIASIVLFVGFVVRQRMASSPLVPLHVFRSRNITVSNVIQVLVVAGAFAFFFLYSLYLRNVLAYSAVQTGLAFLPVTVAIGGFSLGPGAWFMSRFGPSRPLIVGLALSGCSLAIFALASVTAPPGVTLGAMALMGVGFGLAFPCVMTFAMVDATPETSGVVSGLINTTGEAGGTFGVAALAALAASQTLTAGSDGASHMEALVYGYRWAFAAGAACLFLAALLALVLLRIPANAIEQTADSNREPVVV